MGSGFESRGVHKKRSRSNTDKNRSWSGFFVSSRVSDCRLGNPTAGPPHWKGLSGQSNRRRRARSPRAADAETRTPPPASRAAPSPTVARSAGSGSSGAPPAVEAVVGRVEAAGCCGTEAGGVRAGDAGLEGVAGTAVAGGALAAAVVAPSGGEAGAGAGATGAGTAGAGAGATGAVVGTGAGLAVAVGRGLDGAVGWQGPRGNTITGAHVSAPAGAAEIVRARTVAASAAATAPGEGRRIQR